VLASERSETMDQSSTTEIVDDVVDEERPERKAWRVLTAFYTDRTRSPVYAETHVDKLATELSASLKREAELRTRCRAYMHKLVLRTLAQRGESVDAFLDRLTTILDAEPDEEPSR
jgi:hypothetical protein